MHTFGTVRLTYIELEHVEDRSKGLPQHHWSIVRQSGHDGRLDIVSRPIDGLGERIQTIFLVSRGQVVHAKYIAD